MTTSIERMAKGWGLIAEGAMEISLAYSALEPAVARAAVSESAPPTVAAGVAPSALAAPSFDELPPEDFHGRGETVPGGSSTFTVGSVFSGSGENIPMKPQVDAGLGKCPIHGIGWTIKAGGVSKAGKPYKAFWKCAERDDDAFCTQKPQPIWAQTHPAEAVA